MRKHRIGYALIFLISSCCISIGGGNVVAYLTGFTNLTKWFGGVPMAFGTSFLIGLLGLAIFIISKITQHHGKILGQV